MRYLLTIITLLVIQMDLKGQGMSAQEKIESARIAFITQRIELTPDQAEKFWPVYNEFTDKRKALMKEGVIAKKKAEIDGLSEEESKELIDLRFELKQKELQLENIYRDRMLDIISHKQLVALRAAEEDFRKMLIERLKRRRSQGENRKR